MLPHRKEGRQANLCDVNSQFNDKHLMSGIEGNIEIRAKQNELFPEGNLKLEIHYKTSL